MFRVVGCRACDAIWIVSGRPTTTGCPRCGARYQLAQLHIFAETDDLPAARRARASLLEDRAGNGDATAAPGDIPLDQLDSVGISDAEYLAASGLDADAVAEAGERAGGGPGRVPNRRDVVFAAFDAFDRPTEAEIVDFATDRGVPSGHAVDLLERLVQAGEVSVSDGQYRRL